MLSADMQPHPLEPFLLIKAQTEDTTQFLLRHDLTLTSPISVITGLNGSGKSRFIESLRAGRSTLLAENKALDRSATLAVPTNGLIAQFNDYFHLDNYEANLTALLRCYRSYLKGEPLNAWPRPDQGGMGGRSSLRPEDALQSIEQTAEILGKDPKKLADAELKTFHGTGPIRSIDAGGLSTLFNLHIRQKTENEVLRIKSLKNPNISYVAPERWEERFGEKPWLALNSILNKTFSGKFQINLPAEESELYDYRITLEENGAPIDVENLSGGEKTLLWLAVSTFNATWRARQTGIVQRLLLLDEPDASLHPKMVEQLYSTLNQFWEKFGIYTIITTHSPTTVALAREGSIYRISNGNVDVTSRDAAVALLLDGIPQISIDPENRRQVFVESNDDAEVYQAAFDLSRNRSPELNPSISLNFISSGAKFPRLWVTHALESHYGAPIDDATTTAVHNHLNCHGDCALVIGMVEALSAQGSSRTRGLIDWDGKTHQQQAYVSVMGNGTFYSLENWLLDPIAMTWCLWFQADDGKRPILKDFPRVTSREWLESKQFLQKSVDDFLLHFLGRVNARDIALHYASGLTIQSDKAYVGTNGHKLEKRILELFPDLKKLKALKGGRRSLKLVIFEMFFNRFSEGKLIPATVIQAFKELQA